MYIYINLFNVHVHELLSVN